MGLYNYKPLKEREYIRLIEVAPGHAEEQLRGYLRHFSKASLPRYEALSYTWGSADMTDLFTTPSGSLGLTSSLYSALKKLRLPKENRLVWADAICINQMDNEEKSQQVGKMRSIYENAERVIVFLGEDIGDSKLAIALLRRIADTDFGPPQRIVVENQFESLDLPVAAHPAWVAIKNLMKRPWFRRVWIIQECVVAKEVMIFCGDWTEKWSTFEGGILKMLKHKILETNWSSIGNPDSGDQEVRKGAFCLWMITWIRNHLKEGRRIPLLTLLTLCRSQEATRARDHLFALLGIADYTGNRDLDPSYEEAFDVVVRRYARFFIGTKDCMKLLHTASYHPEQCRFPSWIPDWTTADLVQPALGDTNTNGLYFAAGQSDTYMRLSEEDSDTLIVRGGLFDVITKICNDPWIVNLGSRAEDRPYELFLTSDHVMDTIASYPTNEELSEVQWRTLIGNRMLEGRTMPDSFLHAPAHMVRSYQAARQFSVMLKYTTMANILSKTPAERQQVEEFMIRHGGPSNYPDIIEVALPYMQSLNPTHGWAFGRTQRGYVGLFPIKAQAGDTIHIFTGGPTPFVLRKFDNHEDQFHLIGDCYVHGIMQGEALELERFQFRNILLK